MLARLIHKLRKSLRRRGVVGTVKQTGKRLWEKIEAQSPAQRRDRRLKAEKDREFDRRYNVDTAGFIQLDRLSIDGENREHGFAYDPIDPEKFDRTVGSVTLRHEDYVFIDFGSGKGKSVLLASQLPFQKVIGVELSPELHQIAQRNAVTFRSDNQRCKEIEFVCADAATYLLPPVPVVLFFFNPFGEEVMARVIDNVRRSYEEHPREIVILYATPVLDALWAQVPFLAKLHSEGAYLSAYKTKAPV